MNSIYKCPYCDGIVSRNIENEETWLCAGCGEIFEESIYGDGPIYEVVVNLDLYQDDDDPDRDSTDMICPTCGDPDCSRPWGHPMDD